MCIGYMTHSWNLISYVPMDYKANTDYTLEVVVYDNEFAVLLNGEKVFLYETKDFVNGTVGIRTWRQSYECSEFSVRTLGPEDYEYFGGYSVEKQLPITWSCSDYNPNLPAKYGFVGTANSDLITSGVAATKVIVIVDETAVNAVGSANETVESDYEVQ